MKSKIFRKSYSQICKNQRFLLLYIGIVVLFAYIFLFYVHFNGYGQYHKDVRYLVSDSFEIERLMSGKVVIDDKTVYEVDTLCRDIFFKEIFCLNKGEHIIQLISADNRFCFSDTITTNQCKLNYQLLGYCDRSFYNKQSSESIYLSQKLYFGADIRHSRIKLFKKSAWE